jgi:non-canonical poly(A) RNA polymerase PAPD5/7
MWSRVSSVVRNDFSHHPEEIQADTRLFGSCSTGFALPTSDIDIFITGFEYTPKQQLSMPMTFLAQTFASAPWVIFQEAIFTSAIPVLKMDVDPAIPDETSSYNLSDD